MRHKTFAIFLCMFIFFTAQVACTLFSPELATEMPPQQPAVTNTAQATLTVANIPGENCPALTAQQTSPTGLVDDVVMAKNVEETTMAPVEATRLYGSHDIFHAVVHIENAPANSKIRAVWYATDVGEAAACNTRIDAHEISADGTRYIDFNLTPDTNWPAGLYRAEVFFNDNFERVLDFTVE